MRFHLYKNSLRVPRLPPLLLRRSRSAVTKTPHDDAPVESVASRFPTLELPSSSTSDEEAAPLPQVTEGDSKPDTTSTRPARELTLAERDSLAHQKMLDRDGGSLGIEKAEWNGLRPGVKENMVRTPCLCMNDQKKQKN